MAAVIFAITLSSEELDGVDAFDVNHGDIAYREWLVPDKIANRVSRGRLSIDSRIAAFEPDQPVVDGEQPT